MAQGSTAFDQQVADYLRTIAVPRRLREPRVAARFEGVAPTMVATRWGEVACWRHGDGPAVLLVHGFEDDSSLWSPLIDVLVERGRAVVAFDLPAHGASTGEWGVSFEGCDAIKAVDPVFGPIDAVVAHSAGCGVTVGAIGEGWSVDRAVFVAPPMSLGDESRWIRKARQLGVPLDVASAAEAEYWRVHGPARAAWRTSTAYRSLTVDALVVQSRDDEHNDVDAVTTVFTDHPHARLELVDGLAHRRTARDPAVIGLIADFVVE
ncbi:MAG TPA: alpha/beta fold hydrolase [Acidimicrobiales bacterium]|nr:alpha/beta fold hydrolase [Acidimicrobiales bacterium]